MKVTVRLVGDGLARADALANDVRRRAIEHLEARAARRRDKPQPAIPTKTTPNTR